MKRITSLLVFLILGSLSSLFAQSLTVTGTVTDASNGEALPGVNVVVKGTTTGTITSVDGSFKLESVKANDTITFSFVGYITENVVVANRSAISLELSPDITTLSEVVVVGYGSMERTNVTGAISTMKSDEIMKAPVVNPLEALRGQVAGVRVTKGSGMPGQGDIDVLIRGKKSFSSGNDPIIVIDGVPTTGGNMAEINANDIESINILKDAAAASIYGASAANGVILITTKSGTKGATSVSLNISAGPTSLIQQPKMFDAEGYYQLKREAFMNRNNVNDATLEEVLIDPIEYQNYLDGKEINWHDLLLRKGMQQDYNLSITGGTEKFKYYLNGNAFLEKGIVQYSDYKRFSFRLNTDYTVNKFITVGAKVQVSQSQADETGNTLYQGNSDFTDFVGNTPLGRTENENGELVPTVKGDQFQYNPLFRYRESDQDRFADRFFVSPYLEINIIDGLKYRMNSYVEKRVEKYNRFESSIYRISNIGEEPGDNYMAIENTDITSYLFDNILTYSKKIGKHNFDATAVYGCQTFKSDSLQIWGEGASTDLLSYFALNGTTVDKNDVDLLPDEWANLYLVGRLSYAYDQRYVITLTARRDGSSKFGENNRFGTFPSASFAWNLNNESFLANSSVISLLKYRLSYGTMGKDKVPTSAAYALTDNATYPFNGIVENGYTTGSAANKSLHWETSKQINTGIDFGLYRQRISGTFDIYRTSNVELILREQIPIVYGSSTMYSNVGETETNGIELGVNFKVIDNNFKWDVFINGAHDKNKIISLNRAQVDAEGNPIDDIANGWFIGEDIDALYDYKFVGIYQLGEEATATAMHPDKAGYGPGMPKITDISGPDGVPDGIITFADQTILGSPTPKYYGGIRNTVSYKGLELTVLLETVQGVTKVNTFYSGDLTGRDNAVEVDYWTPTNPSNVFPRPHAVRGYYYNNAVRVRDASFVALRNISLTYSLPKNILSKTPIKAASLYVQGNNLKYWTDYKDCYTPEGDAGAFPMIKTWIFGTNITF